MCPPDDGPHRDEVLEAKLAAARERFARFLPERLSELAAALETAARDPASRQRATDVAHRLRGTAALFGFPCVGRSAGAIDDALRDSPPDLDRARAALEEARRALSG